MILLSHANISDALTKTPPDKAILYHISCRTLEEWTSGVLICCLIPPWWAPERSIPNLQKSRGYTCTVQSVPTIATCMCDFPKHLDCSIFSSTYVTANRVRAQVSASMSAHLMMFGLILEFDVPINVNHVSAAQTCKPLRGKCPGKRRANSMRCCQVSNAIELPDLLITLMCSLIILSSPHITYPKIKLKSHLSYHLYLGWWYRSIQRATWCYWLPRETFIAQSIV